MAQDDFSLVAVQPVKDSAAKQGIIARVSAAIKAFRGIEDLPVADLSPRQNTTELGASDAAYSSFSNPLWRIEQTRRAVYADLDEMDLNDPVVASALDIHADCSVGYEDTKVDGFDWLMETENAEARKVLDSLKNRLDLGQEVWHIVRGFVKFGEEFRELVVDPATGDVVRFKHLPSYQITPNLDAYGNKQPGWKQHLDGAVTGKGISFEEWQIVAFVYGARRGWYGTGLMMPARRTWKRLTKLEDGMILARLVRAYDRYLHKIPVKPEWDARRQQEAISQYKENMTVRKGLDTNGHIYQRNNPLDVPTDLYIPDDGTERGGVEPLQAQNTQLQNIEDVRYHQEMLLSRLKVPRKFLNLTSGRTGALMDGGLDAEDVQFARTLRQEQAVLRAGLMRLASIALLLQGYNAKEIGLNVNLPMISTSDMLKDAKIQLASAQAANFFASALAGLPADVVSDKFMKLEEKHKVAMVKFVADEKAEAAALEKEKQKSLMRGRPGGVEGNGADPDDVVQAVTNLKMMVHRQLEQDYNVKFNVGRAEITRAVRQALEDEVLGSMELGLGR